MKGMKKFFTAVILISALALSALGTVFAEETSAKTLTAEVLNGNKLTKYHVFDNASDIFFTDEGLYISVSGGCDVFSDGEFTHTDSRPQDMTTLNGIVSLENGDIVCGSETAEGDYTAISAFDNVLYALRGNNIDKFVYADGKLSASGIYAACPSEINNIAAVANGCAYTYIASDGYTTVLCDGENTVRISDEDVLDIAYKDMLYVLTPTQILGYTDLRLSPVKFGFGGAYARKFTAGDRLYVLTKSASVVSVALDLSGSSTLIASGSDESWFYHAPVGGSTRLGKIYVADRDLGRVSVIDGDKISYLEGLNQPRAVAADNLGTVYVAHQGNKIASFSGGKLTGDEVLATENIVDIEVDYDNNLFILTENGKVLSADGETQRENVAAFSFQNGWHYLSTDGFIDDTNMEIDADDFCTDILGNMFAVKGNKIIASIGGALTEYTVENAAHIASVAISKVENDYVSYGDLLLFDDVNKCVLVLDGDKVGSADVKKLFAPPELTDEAIARQDGIIGACGGEVYMFALPIEGEISRTLKSGDNVIICKDISSPEPFVYCICDDVENDILVGGYVYADALEILPYITPKHAEAKISIDNTHIYKYPTVHSPRVDTYGKDKMVSVLPFAVTGYDEYGDAWYEDGYSNKWYRIGYGDNEGYILTANTNVNFFSDAEMPKTNATVIEDATIYRLDEASGQYVEFEAAGLFIKKDTRVAVDTPFDTSRKYTKVVFYREGYGTIDAECYVRTEFIKFDGVDIVKIIAVAVIIVAVIVLIFIFVRRRMIIKKRSRARHEQQ